MAFSREMPQAPGAAQSSDRLSVHVHPSAILLAAPLAVALTAYGAEFPPRELMQAMSKAFTQEPNLKAAAWEAEGAHAEGDHHAVWEAPDLGIEFYEAPLTSFPNPLKKQQEIDYSVQQAIPWPGKLKPKSEAAHLRGEALEKSSQGAILRTAMELTEAYGRLVLAEARLGLNAEARKESEAMAVSLRARYETGAGRQADWLSAEGDAVELKMEAARLQAARRTAQADWLQKLGQGNVQDTVHVLKTLDSFVPRPLAFAVEALIARAQQLRPDLESDVLNANASERDAAAARRSLWPDVMIKTTYKDMLGGMPDDWALMVGFKASFVPWAYSGYRHEVRMAVANHEKNRQLAEARRLAVVREVTEAHARFQSAWEVYELLDRERLPLAEQVRQSVLSELAQGRTEYSGALGAWRDVRKAREDGWMAKVECLMAFAQLAAAVGVPPEQWTQWGDSK